MPRTAAPRVQDSASKTRWTLSPSSPPRPPPSYSLKPADDIMQANGYHHHLHQHEQPLPRYSDYDGSHYDGSQYSAASRPESDADWRPPLPVNGGGDFGSFDFHHTPQNEVTALSLDTDLRTPNPDGVGRHLLYETALMDTQHFQILDIDEVDALKKEQARLISRIEAAQRKLVLESKVRDAAQNLQRLYSTNKRPDTPQSPDSPGNKKRNSLLPGGGRTRAGSNGGLESGRQAESEFAISVKKVDELHDQIKDLLDRRQEVERKLLRHTAAVLAEEANRVVESGVPGVTNGHSHFEDDYASSYAVNDFDGIRDILQNKPAGSSNDPGRSRQYEQQLTDMQTRLEQLNFQLRNVISEAGQTLGKAPAAEVGLDQSNDSGARIENRFVRIEHNVQTLEQQQQDFRAEAEQNLRTLEQLERDEKGVEDRMESVNGQLHAALLRAANNQPVPGLQDPPQSGGHGYQNQLQYMEDGLGALERLLQQRGNPVELAEARAKNQEYESTVGGLWELLQSDAASVQPGQNGDGEPTPKTMESFSLPAFNSRVQNLFDRAQSAREQQDILRRQIQQQRELGGKSDMEKDRQIAEIQGKHDQLNQEHGAVQQDLANLMVKHEQAEGEANQSRTELMKVMAEVDELNRTIESKQTQLRELQTNESQAEGKHAEMHQNMEKLESEIVRLTTELTMAKAELDGAYGTRAQRAGAQAAEVDALNSKNKNISSELETLRAELHDMTNEFQELTKESIGLEKEREQLDAVIDGLRDKCHELEAQLNDERMARVGLQKTEEQEQRSMLVLKQEFKKMMREQKAEGAKLLRNEQDERRKVEAELRKMRQAGGPLARGLQARSETPAPA